MKKKIDIMTWILQKNNLEDQILEGSKKKPEDHAPKGNHHALVVVHSSLDAWIVNSSTSHHMDSIEDILYSLTACNGTPILMGDDSLIEVSGKGRVEIDNGIFKNVLFVPQLSMNMLLVYQITHLGSGKNVEFTPDSMAIFEMKSNSKVTVGEVNHQSRLYTFSKFFETYSYVILAHADDCSILWHETFGHLNFRYMQQLSKKGMVTGLPDIHFSEGVCEGCILDNMRISRRGRLTGCPLH
jgi:hypothetical protein